MSRVIAFRNSVLRSCFVPGLFISEAALMGVLITSVSELMACRLLSPLELQGVDRVEKSCRFALSWAETAAVLNIFRKKMYVDENQIRRHRDLFVGGSTKTERCITEFFLDIMK